MSENTVNTENKGGYAGMTEEQKALAKAKQVEAMKSKWQDPVYQASVAYGRHFKAVEKLNAEIADLDAKIAEADEENAKVLTVEKAKLVAKLAVSQSKVDAAKAIIDAATPAPAPAPEAPAPTEGE